MRKIGCLLALLMPLLLISQTTKRVLFIGNSYTAGMPQVVAEIAKSMGDSLIFLEEAPGGQSIKNHAQSVQIIQAIQQQPWDYVVLQCQSQEAAFNPTYVQTNVFPYAKILADTIRAFHPCAKPLFYMTWGRKNGDQSNCQYYQPLCTYEGMQLELRKNYLKMAFDNNASASPVGMAWRRVRQTASSINLYSGDESHPNQEGTFLTACTFYNAIFGKMLTPTIYTSNLPATTVDTLRKAANSVVFDSLSTWNINFDSLRSSFTFQQNYDTVRFTNTTTGADSIFWDFGDGNSSTLLNPVHVYDPPAHYLVSLSAYKGCQNHVYDTVIESFEPKHDTTGNPSDTATQPGDTTALFLTYEEDMNSEFHIYPNPAGESIFITDVNFNKPSAEYTVTIMDSFGREMDLVTLKNSITQIDCREFKKGLYFFILKNENGHQLVKKILIHPN